MPSPAFNVSESFQGITIVAMNSTMASMLMDFIVDVETDTSLQLLSYALDPHSRRRPKNLDFGVVNCCPSESSNEVIIVALNFRISKILQDLIDSFDNMERELIAFRRALANPEQSREIRDNKRAARDNQSSDYEREEREEARSYRRRIEPTGEYANANANAND